MAETVKPASPPAPHPPSDPQPDTVVCERCGSPRVYRMHAVWRCADCGYKTDCCGW